tara:strand:- start:1203 stop:1322 length:120 start_codon:yes stop_codon:yes gene_type:complete
MPLKKGAVALTFKNAKDAEELKLILANITCIFAGSVSEK